MNIVRRCSQKGTLIFLLVLVFSFVCCLKVGAIGEKVTSAWEGISRDTPHGTLYALDLDKNYVMNQNTEAVSTPNETKVSSWPYTGHISQYWDTWTVHHPYFNNARMILPDSNFKLALNINRTTHVVNVYEVEDNYYKDCCLEVYSLAIVNGTERYQYYVQPRYSYESNMALKGTASKGAYFTWQSGTKAGTMLYRIGA